MYRNGKIYKITSDVGCLRGMVYVGSTYNTLSRRLHNHKQMARQERSTSKLYTTMNIHGIENFRISLIEHYRCDFKDELLVRENYWMTFYKSIKKGWNTNAAILSPEQRSQYNRDKSAEYYLNNRDKVCEYYRNKRINPIYYCKLCSIGTNSKKKLAEHFATNLHNKKDRIVDVYDLSYNDYQLAKYMRENPC